MFAGPSRKPGTTRRQFAKECLSMMTGSATATMMQLQLTQSLLAQTGGINDFRALVCLFLYGGNDSFNMLTPYDQAEYNSYESIRGTASDAGLAIPRDQLLPISDPSGRTFGLHPSLTDLKTLYDQGDLAFVANVGSLVVPTDITLYLSETNLPLGLFSHADLTRHWHTSVPQSRHVLTGWGGRMADILTDPANRNAPISMNIALNQVNGFQAAKYANPYVVTAGGATERDGYFGNWAPDEVFFQAHEDMLNRPHSNLIEQTYVNATKQAINAAAQYNVATSDVTLQTQFPNSYLAEDLERVARTIAAHSSLGHPNLIFFVSFGGWDHHGDLLGPHGDMLGEVGAALKAFHDAMVELQLTDKVVTFTASDFARTLAGNGQGSDHGWGGNQIVMGGPVSGGRVYGQYPETLASGNELDVGRGRLIPTTSVDQYAAELAMWLGIRNDNQLETILPNIRNFYSASATEPPLGFLA